MSYFNIIYHRRIPNESYIGICPGQTRVFIYTPFVQLESLMLWTKFQDHWTSGSEK